MKIYFVILLSSLVVLSYAQDTLQMDELISTALQNNLNLKIAKNNTEGAKTVSYTHLTLPTNREV